MATGNRFRGGNHSGNRFEVVATSGCHLRGGFFRLRCFSEWECFEKLLADPLNVISAVALCTYTAAAFGDFDDRSVHQAERLGRLACAQAQLSGNWQPATQISGSKHRFSRGGPTAAKKLQSRTREKRSS